jgi:hypothetical protein
MKYLFVFLLMSLLLSCVNDDYPVEGQSKDGFEDGTYCADITYYNPNTGNSNDYILEVEVSNNQIYQINFNNGGWLDSEHMSPESIDENGECTIITDRNYEYSIRITGKNCGNMSSVNPENDKSLPRYNFSQCSSLLNLSEYEIEKLINIGYHKSNIYSILQLENMGDYIYKLRELNRDHAREIEAIKNEQRKMERSINNGYIQSVSRRRLKDQSLCQTVVISKKGVNYLFIVRGNRVCDTGSAEFNENSNNWQTIYIKKSPNASTFNGYSMKIVQRGGSITYLKERFWDFCGL